MNHSTTTLISIAGLLCYLSAVIGAITLPLWAYKLIEGKLSPRHKALRVSPKNLSPEQNTTCIIASLGTTTAGVFLIQILPLIFSIIGDVAGPFAMNIIYSDHVASAGQSNFVGEFYGLTAQLGDMLQTAAPLAAVGLGGYNLLNNLSRGLPAIRGRND